MGRASDDTNSKRANWGQQNGVLLAYVGELRRASVSSNPVVVVEWCAIILGIGAYPRKRPYPWDGTSNWAASAHEIFDGL